MANFPKHVAANLEFHGPSVKPTLAADDELVAGGRTGNGGPLRPIALTHRYLRK